jgi:ABC-2 type transport system permease protein
MPPLWEILTSIGILAVSVLIGMWAAGKIFRTAILAYGKRLTLPELARLLRTR